MRLKDRVALITGGTSGIGEQTVRLFIKEGAKVAFTGRWQAQGQALQTILGNRALYIEADHSQAEDCQRSIEAALEHFGRIDVLFNNAGIVPGGRAEDTSEAVWANTLNVNVTAVWRMCKGVIPLMRAGGGGVIVNNASDWGIVGGYNSVAYCASKGAVVQMTKAMALDHARENIRINAVCPGDTYVERWSRPNYPRYQGNLEAMKNEMGQALPMGRVGSADEIAKAVLFLASDDSSFMTGATLLVDGGNTAV